VPCGQSNRAAASPPPLSSLFSRNTLHAGRPASSTHRHRARGRLLRVQYCSGPAMRHLPPAFPFQESSCFPYPHASSRLTSGLWPPPARFRVASERINNDWVGRPRYPARLGSPSFMICLIAGALISRRGLWLQGPFIYPGKKRVRLFKLTCQ
jgi:hypothetical protein